MEEKIFEAFIDLITIFNRPDRDRELIARAGVNLEAAAFGVLVGIGHLRSAGVGELAATMGKNYSSVSRQIDKLESAGLVRTSPSKEDARVRMSELTEEGQQIVSMIAKTRHSIMREAMADWTEEEKTQLLRALQRFTGALSKID